MTRIEGQMSQLLGLAQARPAAPPAPPDMEAIARATIEQGKREEAAKDEAAQREGRLKAVEEKVAKVTETKPKQPITRFTRFMWPGHDRA